MKKILFVESRYVTYLYEAIAERLIQNGYQVYWLILNHQFKPKNGLGLFLDYPSKNHNSVSNSDYLQTVIETDRHPRFFDLKSTSHFHFYDLKIRKQIEQLKPDIVFGEPTAFHHLISIEVCRQLNILYLHPGTCRYPLNRFAFYEYDTLKPYLGSGEILKDDDAELIINSIVERKAIPHYMIAPSITFKEKINNKLKILTGYILGERFNTPSPIVKLRKNRQNRTALREWDRIATNTIDNSKFTILYPLHMQPESSIDVWGREFSDQADTINEIASRLSENEILYVKPNPKSSFEISSKLIKLLRLNDNIKALTSGVKMEDVFDKIDLVINVVGTVSIECILSDKPVISLVRTYFNDTKSSYNISSFDDINKIINDIKSGDIIELNSNEKIEYINKLNSSSYKGLISDTFNNKDITSEKNIDMLYNAFKDVIQRN